MDNGRNKAIGARQRDPRPIRNPSANVFFDFADVSRGPARKDDHNGDGRGGGGEQRVVDGGSKQLPIRRVE